MRCAVQRIFPLRCTVYLQSACVVIVSCCLGDVCKQAEAGEDGRDKICMWKWFTRPREINGRNIASIVCLEEGRKCVIDVCVFIEDGRKCVINVYVCIEEGRKCVISVCVCIEEGRKCVVGVCVCIEEGRKCVMGVCKRFSTRWLNMQSST